MLVCLLEIKINTNIHKEIKVIPMGLDWLGSVDVVDVGTRFEEGKREEDQMCGLEGGRRLR